MEEALLACWLRLCRVCACTELLLGGGFEGGQENFGGDIYREMCTGR